MPRRPTCGGNRPVHPAAWMPGSVAVAVGITGSAARGKPGGSRREALSFGVSPRYPRSQPSDSPVFGSTDQAAEM